MQLLHVGGDRAGLGMVSVGALVIAASVNWLPVSGSEHDLAWTTSAVTTVVALGCAAGRVAQRSRRLTVVYAVILFVALAVLGGHQPLFGQVYGGLYTIGFVFVGLFAARGSALALTPPAAFCWWVTNGGFGSTANAVLLVRLPIALSIWIGVAELLSARAAQARGERDRLANIAELDPLTGLSNRRALAGTFSELKPGDALVLVDFDHFKAVNDNHGHSAGDRVLVDFADMVRTVLRRDDQAIRYGGEEILLHLTSPQAQDVAAVLSRLREAWWRRQPLATYSSGAAIAEPGEAPTATLARADDLLYRAKDAGRDRDVLDGAPATSKRLRRAPNVDLDLPRRAADLPG